jgi:bacterial/archaeal transporter family-2 protein
VSDHVVVAAPEQPMAATRSKRSVAARVALLVVTVIVGTLVPLQSAVNGALAGAAGDGNAAAVVSLGSGLLIMIAVVGAHPRLRRCALRLPGLIRRGNVGRWNYLAGLCGAAVVLSQGIAVGSLGVAVFHISMICGLIISGVVCDRIGVAATQARPLSGVRLLGAGLALVATVLAVSPTFHAPHAIFLAALPFGAGLLAGWQPAGNAEVGKESGSLIVAIALNFLVSFAALSVVLLIRLASGTAHFALPPVWWMYTGGVLGVLYIGTATFLVRGLGLLLLGLATTAGQLIGSLLFNGVIPGTVTKLHVVTVVGTFLALVAAAIAAISTRPTAESTSAG